MKFRPKVKFSAALVHYLRQVLRSFGFNAIAPERQIEPVQAFSES